MPGYKQTKPNYSQSIYFSTKGRTTIFSVYSCRFTVITSICIWFAFKCHKQSWCTGKHFGCLHLLLCRYKVDKHEHKRLRRGTILIRLCGWIVIVKNRIQIKIANKICPYILFMELFCWSFFSSSSVDYYYPFRLIRAMKCVGRFHSLLIQIQSNGSIMLKKLLCASHEYEWL